MKLRKPMLLTLTASLALGGLAACSGGSGGPGTGSAENPAGGSQDAAKPGAGAAQGPVSFSLVMNGRGQYIETLKNINDDPYVKKLEELTKTDLNIELILDKDYQQKMTLKMSSGDIPDVVKSMGGSIYGKELAGSVQAGVFMPLDELLQKHGQNLLKKIPQEAWERVKVNGKIMGIPAYNAYPNTLATYIRKDMMDKAGVTQVPKTVDEYLNMLRAFKKLGVETPFHAQDKFALSDSFFQAYDVWPWAMEFQNGQVVPKFFKADAMMKALQVYKTMLDEGLMSKEFTTNNGNNLAQFVYSPKVGTVQLGSSALLSVNKKLKAAVPEGEYINALSPVGPDGKGGPMVGSPVSFVMLINNKVPQDKAAAIVKFFDWMQTEEGDKFFTYGLEGTDFTMDNGKINYKFPQTPEEINREEFHQHILWFINDKSIFKREYMNPEAKPVIDFVTKELVKEGRSTISFDPPLESSTQNPDVGADSPFILEHITKMIYGKEPISDWPKVIEEWKKKGGDAVIKEATDRYNKKMGVYMPIR